MPQAKKKKSTKTAAKRTTATKTRKKAASRTSCKKCTLSSRDRMHVCIVTVLSITAGILLCIDAAMMIVS